MEENIAEMYFSMTYPGQCTGLLTGPGEFLDRRDEPHRPELPLKRERVVAPKPAGYRAMEENVGIQEMKDQI